jgi:hypothetical protein
MIEMIKKSKKDQADAESAAKKSEEQLAESPVKGGDCSSDFLAADSASA